MGFVHGVNTQLIIDDTTSTTYFNKVEWAGAGEVSETTTFGVTGQAKTFIRGLNGGTVSLGGLYDSSAPDVELAAQRTATVSAPTTIGIEGLALGKAVKLLAGKLTEYKVSSPVGDVVATSAAITADGPFDSGFSLLDLTSKNATGFGTAVDNGAASSNGGVAQIHCVTNTRNGAITVLVEHSTDNVSFTTLATFTNLTTATTSSERIAVAAGATVNRYVRYNVSVVGGTTGAATIQVSFARR